MGFEKLKEIKALLPDGDSGQPKKAVIKKIAAFAQEEDEIIATEFYEMYSSGAVAKKGGILRSAPPAKKSGVMVSKPVNRLVAATEHLWQVEMSGNYVTDKNGIRRYSAAQSLPSRPVAEKNPAADVRQATKPQQLPVEDTAVVAQTCFARLGEFLRRDGRPALKIKFEKIEQILDAELDTLARQHKSWWANDPSRERARLWLAAGYAVAGVVADAVLFKRLESKAVQQDEEQAALRVRLAALELQLSERRDVPIASDADQLLELHKQIDFLNRLVSEYARHDKPQAQLRLPQAVLIIGASPLATEAIYAVAAKCGFPKCMVELHNDYKDNKRYDFSKLRNSRRFGAVIVGPNAHKVTGLGDFSSVLAKLQGETGYPQSYVAHTESGELKISRRALEKALSEARQQLDAIVIA